MTDRKRTPRLPLTEDFKRRMTSAPAGAPDREAGERQDYDAATSRLPVATPAGAGPSDLAERIRSEANIADRPGQFGRLEAIADEVERLHTALEQAERDRDTAETQAANWSEDAFVLERERDEARAALAELRRRIEGLADEWAGDTASGVKIHCGRRLRALLNQGVRP